MTTSTESPLPAKHPEIEALRRQGLPQDDAYDALIDAAERRMDELAGLCAEWQETANRRLREMGRERDEAQRMASDTVLHYAFTVSQDRYERAYLAALTGHLSSGTVVGPDAHLWAHADAERAVLAFEARAKERG